MKFYKSPQIDWKEVMWNNIIKLGEEDKDRDKTVMESSGYSSTKMFLTGYIEKDGEEGR